MEIYKTVTVNLKLDMRMNLKSRKVRSRSRCLREWNNCSDAASVGLL